MIHTEIQRIDHKNNRTKHYKIYKQWLQAYTQYECRSAPFFRVRTFTSFVQKSTKLTKKEKRNEAKEKNERGAADKKVLHILSFFSVVGTNDTMSHCVCVRALFSICFVRTLAARLFHSAERARIHIVCYFTKEMKSIFIATLTAIDFVQLNFYVLDMFLPDIFSCSAMFPIYEFTL